MLETILKEEENKLSKKKNIWKNSRYEFLKTLSATKKGSVGETIVKKILENRFKNVNKHIGNEYDLTQSKKRIEVKTSILNDTGLYKFLQIRLDDNYTHVALLAIEPKSIRLFLVPKYELGGLKPQHGGERQNNNIVYLGIKPNVLYKKYSKYEVKTK
jgi:hypothetical protein